MREIKFRIWIKDESKMIYLDDKENDVEINFLNNITSNHETYWEVVTKVSDLRFAHMPQYFDSRDSENVLMQYTGLKDKNGIPIYEGDLINLGNTGRKHIGVASIVWYGAGFSINQNKYMGWLGKDIANNCEIVGNIYENPELLESK